MAITNAMPTSFKVGLLNGVFNFPTGNGCIFTASITGTSMVVTAVSAGTLEVGQGVQLTASPNAFLTSASAAAYITAFVPAGGGTYGGAGTYTLSTSATVSSSTNNLTAGAFYIALYTSSASLGAGTTVYLPGSANGEAVASAGTSYVTGTTAGIPGGNVLSVSQVPTSGSGTTAFINFANTTWSSVSITANGALIYQNATWSIGGSTLIRPAVAVLAFGGDKTSSTADFTIQFPAPLGDGSAAILRIA
jgi:hypothetical protein